LEALFIGISAVFLLWINNILDLISHATNPDFCPQNLVTLLFQLENYMEDIFYYVDEDTQELLIEFGNILLVPIHWFMDLPDV